MKPQWLTDEGIARRLHYLSADYAFRIVNNALQLYAKNVVEGRAVWRFMTRRDERVCLLCRPWDYVTFKTGQFMPAVPRHFGCRCCYLLVRFE